MYDPTKSLGERLHAAYRTALGHTDGDHSNFPRLPAEDQAFWDRAAVDFVARLSDAPSTAAQEAGRKALAAWDRYDPNVSRANTLEQAVAMANALRKLLVGGTS